MAHKKGRHKEEKRGLSDKDRHKDALPDVERRVIPEIGQKENFSRFEGTFEEIGVQSVLRIKTMQPRQ